MNTTEHSSIFEKFTAHLFSVLPFTARINKELNDDSETSKHSIADCLTGELMTGVTGNTIFEGHPIRSQASRIPLVPYIVNVV